MRKDEAEGIGQSAEGMVHRVGGGVRNAAVGVLIDQKSKCGMMKRIAEGIGQSAKGKAHGQKKIPFIL